MILPEDLEQFLKADVFWLVHHSDYFCMASSSLKETERTAHIYWQHQFMTSYLFPKKKNHWTKAEILPSEGRVGAQLYSNGIILSLCRWFFFSIKAYMLPEGDGFSSLCSSLFSFNFMRK